MSKIIKTYEVEEDEGCFSLQDIVIEPPKYTTQAPQDANTQIQQLIALANEEAEAILAEARRQADEMIDEAQKEGDQLFEDAKNAGYHEGYKDGKAQAIEEERGVTEQIHGVLEDLVKQKELFLLDLEPEVLRMTLAIAQKVLCEQIKVDKEKFYTMLTRAIKKVGESDRVFIRVSPEQYHDVLAVKNVVFSQLKKVTSLEILRDELMNNGDLLIETDSGEIDAGITTQIMQIAQAFDVEEVSPLGA